MDFETAARVFDDPEVIVMRDRVVEGEERWHAIGAVSAALLLVVHVYHEDRSDGEEIIRIISAREADQRERRIYIQQAAE
ncbi:MAG TPA: BrnT family toxin [Terriglobia bacterium]|nr:BrnT family toxin [Terriglobia bacterium]